MKIAYLIELELSTPNASGIIRKIYDQTQEWIERNHEVKLFFISAAAPYNPELLNGREYEIIPPKKFKDVFFDLNYIFKNIDSFNPDVVYTRLGSVNLPSHFRIYLKYPTIMEVNSDDIVERKLSMRKTKFIYYLLSRSIAIRLASGIVCVSYELARKFNNISKKVITIPNSINLSRIKPVPPADNKEPVLVFIGTKGKIWHGIDKIIKMAQAFPEWNFEIIGDIKPEVSEIPNNVRLHGYQEGKEYEKILSKCDIGIGTLALHRINVYEISPLKTLEYLAYGLPVIIGYKDPNFINGADFILELPNKESNIEESIEKIKAFVEKWKGKRINRKYIKHIDIKQREKERLAFFQKIANL